MSTAIVLHDLGSEAAGAPWRAVVPEGWEAPDLPGHGTTPAPRHGAYDPLGPTTLARWALAGRGLVVGIGQNAHGALILAAGGVMVVVDFFRPTSFAQKFWGAITCPVVAVETPASTTPPDERAERARWFGGPVQLVELASAEPGDVMAAITSALSQT